MLSRKNDNPELARHYKTYCKVLTEVIKAKKSYYNKLIFKSKNKFKTSWDNILSYLFKVFKHPLPNTSMTPVTNIEIKDMI
jgi:hypothetical protein